MSTRSWISGDCIVCDFPVVVTQPNMDTNPHDDYLWYCSNKKCFNHRGEHTVDTEQPTWVEMQPSITVKE